MCNLKLAALIVPPATIQLLHYFILNEFTTDKIVTNNFFDKIQ